MISSEVYQRGLNLEAFRSRDLAFCHKVAKGNTTDFAISNHIFLSYFLIWEVESDP